MWPDWVSNPEHLPLESDALPTALRVSVCVRERERERERERRERERERERGGEGVPIQSCLQWEILL